MLLKVGVAMMAVALAFAAAVAVAAFLSADPAELAKAVKSTRKPAVEPLTRSDPGVDPRVEKNIPPPRLEPETRQAPVAEVVAAPPPKSNPQLEIKSEPGPRPEPKPGAEPEAPPDPAPQPEPEAQPEQGILPVSEEDWPSPTDEELRAADETRRYDLPPGAIMGLTIKALGLRGVPVIDSDSQWAFDSGVVHEPETSLPWSDTPRETSTSRPTASDTGDLVPARLLQPRRAGGGDRVVLEDREGKDYEYRVSETFVVDPRDVWVMGQVEGKDLLTLQTCTPIPAFDKHLIVRAERV